MKIESGSPLDNHRDWIQDLIAGGSSYQAIADNLQHRMNITTTRHSIRRAVKRWKMAGNQTSHPQLAAEACGMHVEGDQATIIEPPTQRPKLGDVEKLIRDRGLDPKDWVVVSTTLNTWDANVGAGEIVKMNQWKVTLKRAPHLLLATPAIHVPPVKRNPGIVKKAPSITVIEGDHQVPYHDPDLHTASLNFLSAEAASITDHVFLGDLGDFPTISRHADHPSAMAGVNETIQGCYELLRDKAEAAPNANRLFMRGNHDWRVESELLLRAERMYGITPADTGTGNQIPALSLRNLLHLDALGIELVESPLGWEHAEVELVTGMNGLVVRHGWLTGANTAAKSLSKRGRSIIVGHTHQREHHYQWDASAGVERQGVVAGTMSLTRGDRFPHFAVCNNWLSGFVVVTRWPDNHFDIEHVRWNGQFLSWRGKRYG